MDSNQYALIEEVYFEKIRFQNYARPGDCIKAEILLKKKLKKNTYLSQESRQMKKRCENKKIRILKRRDSYGKKRVVITGVGTVNPLGNNYDEFIKNLFEGKMLSLLMIL